jgi:hypothetical protein
MPRTLWTGRALALPLQGHHYYSRVCFLFMQSSTTVHQPYIDVATALRDDGVAEEKRKSQMKKENPMNVRKYLGASVMSVGLLLACGIPALAKDARTVTLSHDVVLNGTTLSAGKCSVEWQTHSPEATVEFVRHHKVVVATEGRVEERPTTYNRDAVVYNTASNGTISILEFRFANSNKVLILNQ